MAEIGINSFLCMIISTACTPAPWRQWHYPSKEFERDSLGFPQTMSRNHLAWASEVERRIAWIGDESKW